MAGELEIEGEEYSLHVRKDGGECEEPHLDEVRDEAVVGGTVKGLVEGTEACLEEVSEVFDY